MSNIKEHLLTELDSNQVIRDIHSEEERSIRVLVNNDLVPNKFSKVVCTYNVDGEVATATYYDNGINQISSFIPNAENGGAKEITIIDFSSMGNLHNKSFVIYDSGGTVGVYFIVDGGAVTPPMDTDRNIPVNLSSLDNARIAAIKTKQTLEMDSEFLGLTSSNQAIIISATAGNKPDSYDVNTGLTFVSTNGESADTLNNKYFFVHTPDEKFHVWFNVDSNGTDPAPPSSTGIETAILTSDSQEVVFNKIINALNETIYFKAYKRNGRVNIFSKKAGPTNEIEDVNTGFNFFTTETFGQEKKIIKTLVLTYDGNNCLTEIDSF